MSEAEPKRHWLRIAICASIAAAVAILACAGAWQLFLSNFGARFPCGQIAELEQMPADDAALGIWVGKQPGVDPYSVVIFREANHLTVHFAIDRNLRGEPELPDLMSKCKALGYVGATGPFRERLAPYSWGSDAWHMPSSADEDTN